MKVLFCVRADYYRNFAGDSMQVVKTAEFLRKVGITVDINDGNIYDYSDYDIIHLFSLMTLGETYKYYRIARQYKKMIVLSPIYQDLRKYYNHIGDIEGLRLWKQCTTYRAEILKGCKMIYPSSYMEQQCLEEQFNVMNDCRVIYNGVEAEDEETPLYSLKERYKLDSYALAVGKVCQSKNQLTLVKICSDLGIKLVLIGRVEDKQYFRECMKYKNAVYLGFMDSYNIYNAYRFAKLHVLASYIEATGLSTLEAAASGCNIVSTSEGYIREYLGDKATYCNPYNEQSIFEAVDKGYRQNKSSQLKKMVKENFSWEKCVEELYESYQNMF